MKTIKGNVFPRKLDEALPLATRAKDVWIEDDRGQRYIDASGGAIVVNLGHGREEIAQAVYDQIISHHYIHPTMFTTPAVEALGQRLAQLSPGNIERFYFMASGSEAVETAVKLARQIHLSNNHPERIKVISRWKSYHGLTLGALSVTGRTIFRKPFSPMLDSFNEHIPPPYCLRCSYGLTYPDCKLRCATALEDRILNLGSETVSAFVGETVSGGTLAAYPPPEGYWPTIRKICDRHNVLLILDEVMCGMGRTGRWFACQHEHVVPDIITMGKGLSGGVIPFSATGVKECHFDAVRQGGDGFAHGGTYSHHPVGAAAALKVLEIMEKENLIERVQEYGYFLEETLHDRLNDMAAVGHIRGIGFMWGIELVADKKTLAPFPRNAKITEKLWDALFTKGIIVYKSTGLAGIDGDALIVAPPFVIEKSDIVKVAESLRQVIKEVIKD
jgi:adenosylmethionine-8-amino-7-oxononanoate aminotransferase